MLTERIETLNRRLADNFGYFDGVQPNYRVAWADDLLEKRLTNYTPEGLELLHPEVREQKKYNYIHEKYILEKLVAVPEMHLQDLTTKLSYECVWVFEDKNGFPLPPIWSALEFIIDTLHKQIGKKVIYKIESEKDEERINKLQNELFGNETSVGDSLAHGYGIVVPSNYIKKAGD